mmetsp:Transcript_6435/g.6986  ORF Transcript_6435/g.6986 Transcript_6435/m.6986 type:complete len:138 (+) Transcript_6435:12-425(+)
MIMKGREVIQNQQYLEGRDKSFYSTVADKDVSYAFCFDNRRGGATPKKLLVNLETTHPFKRDKLLPEDIDMLQKTIIHVERDIHNLQNLIAHHSARFQRHDIEAKNTNGQILFWSLAEFFTLVFITAAQVYFLRCTI